MKRSIARYVYALVVLMFTGFFILGCGEDNSTGHGEGGDGTSDSISPTVTRSYPVPDAPGVPVGISLTATFSEEMDSMLVIPSFTVQKSGLPLGPELPGQVTYTGLIATFNPDNDLDANTEYTATITTDAKDLAGNALASNRVWTFSTDEGLVDGNPTVILTDPADLGEEVAFNRAVTATFSEAMHPGTVNDVTFTLHNGASLHVPGLVTYAGSIATLTPTSDLDINTEYTATISTGAEALTGNALASDYVWTFTTGATSDVTAPTVAPNSPLDLAVDVALNKSVSAIFSESMEPATIDDLTFTLDDGVAVVPGVVTYVGMIATFNPDNDLAAGTDYTATMTTDATDLAGNPLASDEVWTFTTITELAQGPLPVDLGSAEDFAILSKSGISTTGTTFITGNIGVNPITSTAITGFGLILDSSNTFATSTLVSGRVYAPDYAVPTPAKTVTAINDLHTAYVDAAGRTSPDATELYAGDLSGQTIAPGLYKWSTGVLVASGTTVTLSGGANDVWIFQLAGDLTVGTNAIVALDGGAQAKNIFWQVGGGTGVTLETDAQFKGIVLAAKAIEIKDRAAVIGRMLAETQVTLIANAITQP